jgi:monovalent cation/hydrogen antiporter
LPTVMEGLKSYSPGEGLAYGLIISVVAIIVRMLWVFPLAYVPLWFKSTVRADHVNPTWKGPAIIGWAGMRGVVSLAAALSVPLMLNDAEFPHRNLILFITFIVILVTLVFQGLTLPAVIRWVDIKESDETLPDGQQEAGIQLRLKKKALALLADQFADEVNENELLALMKKSLEEDIEETQHRLDSLDCDTMVQEEVEAYNRVLLIIYAEQRKELFHMRREKAFTDDAIRKLEKQLDLEEAKINTLTH